jgi:HK97 family phage major capsid protein
MAILGKEVRFDPNMPAVQAGALSIAYGDYKQGYLILDRVGIRVLRDPYTTKGRVSFYTTKRVGGGVRQFQAIKIGKIATAL